MKAGREHRVPLSPQAMAIVSALHEDGETGFVFSGTSPDKPLSIMAMSMLLRRMKAGVTVHGFRSSFWDWASDTTGFQHEVCEMVLVHLITNTAEAANRRG